MLPVVSVAAAEDTQMTSAVSLVTTRAGGRSCHLLPPRILRIALPLLLVLAAGCAGSRHTVPAGTAVATNIGGLEYIPLHALCQEYNASCQWDRDSHAVLVQYGPFQVRGEENSPMVSINGLQQRLPGPVVVYRGAVMVPRALKDWLPRIGVTPPPAALTPSLPAGANQLRRVMLDPGHGGKDPGASAHGVREKDVVLDIAQRLRQHLSARGVEVLMTRDDDTFIALGERTRLANQRGADLFLSIHANASRNRNAHGVEAYYLREKADGSAWAWAASGEFDAPVPAAELGASSRTLKAILWDLAHAEDRRESVELSMRLCRTLREELQARSRGVRGARFQVLRTAAMPAVLLEVGYLTNTAEEARLGDPSYREAFARALADGVLHYAQQYAQTDGFAR